MASKRDLTDNEVAAIVGVIAVLHIISRGEARQHILQEHMDSFSADG